MPSRGVPCRSPRRPLGGDEQAQPLHVALRDPVGGVALERLLVGLERLGVAAELGQRLAEPVVCVDVAARAREAGGSSRPPPPTRRGWPGRSATRRAGGAAGVVVSRISPRVMGECGVSDGEGSCGRRNRPKGDLLYHRPEGCQRDPPARRSGPVHEQRDEQPEEQPASRTRPRPLASRAPPRSASAAPLQAWKASAMSAATTSRGRFRSSTRDADLSDDEQVEQRLADAPRRRARRAPPPRAGQRQREDGHQQERRAATLRPEEAEDAGRRRRRRSPISGQVDGAPAGRPLGSRSSRYGHRRQQHRHDRHQQQARGRPGSSRPNSVAAIAGRAGMA